MIADFDKLTDAEKAAAFEGLKQHWMRQGFIRGIQHAGTKALDWAEQAEATGGKGSGSGFANLSAVIRGIEPPKAL